MESWYNQTEGSENTISRRLFYICGGKNREKIIKVDFLLTQSCIKDSNTVQMGYFPRTLGLDPKGLILLPGDLWT